MTSDLETRLEYRALCFQPGSPDRALVNEVPAKLAALKAKLSRAKEALRPLAAAADGPDNCGITIYTTEGIVRRAVAVLAELESP